MTFTKTVNGPECLIKVEGSLDAATAPKLLEEVQALQGVKNVTFDFSRLVYISSAGLRVILAAYNEVAPDGTVKAIHTKETIRKILEVMGFGSVVTIE